MTQSNFFARFRARSLRALHMVTACAVIFWSLGPATFMSVLPVSAAIARNDVMSIPVTAQTLTASNEQTLASAAFGMNFNSDGGDTFTRARVVIAPSNGFDPSRDLAGINPSGMSGISLWKDADGSPSGTFNAATDSPVITNPSLTRPNFSKLSVGPNVATYNPNTQASALPMGFVLFAKVSQNADFLGGYAWHIVTTPDNPGTVDVNEFRLDYATNAPVFAAESRASFIDTFVEGGAAGIFAINNSGGNTLTFSAPGPDAIAVGDMVYYKKNGVPGGWGIVTGPFTPTDSPINGANLTAGSYEIARVASASSRITVPSSGEFVPGFGTYTTPQVGDIVLYQEGLRPAQWGMVTVNTLSGGSFAINGAPLAPGTYRISTFKSNPNTYGVMTAPIADLNFSITTGDLAYALSTMPGVSNDFSWNIVTAGGVMSPGSAGLKLNGSLGAPSYGWVVSLVPDFGQPIDADETGNGAGNDYFIAIRASATPVDGGMMSMSISTRDIGFSTNISLAEPQLEPAVTPPYTVGVVQEGPPAPPPSTVTIADNDSSGMGVDGRDITFTWVPANSQPAGFMGYRFFVLPANHALFNGPITTDLFGQPLQDRGFVNQFSQTTFTLPQFSGMDSAGTNLAGGTPYRGCVFTIATTPAVTCSDAPGVQLTSEGAVGNDTQAPMIEHMPVHTIIKTPGEGTPANIYALIFDDRTTPEQFANTGDDGAEYAKMYYGTNVTQGNATIVNGVQVTGNLFRFTIPADQIPAIGSTLKYYLAVRDRAAGDPGNVRYFCAGANAQNAAACQQAPFNVNVVDVPQAPFAVSGVVSSSDVAVEGAYVFASGVAKTAVQTAGNGTYTLPLFPQNADVDIIAYKANYCRDTRHEKLTASKVNFGLSIMNGMCQPKENDTFTGNPVRFSGPPDHANGVPLNETIRVGFNSALDASSVDDSDASDQGSNVYLTFDGQTHVGGTVKYCAVRTNDGACSALMQGDEQTIIFDPTLPLVPNMFYSLIMTKRVLSDTGMPLQGNRAKESDGGHQISFMTQGDTTATYNQNNIATNFGNTGQFMPPYVESMMPGSVVKAARNVNILLKFNQQMDSATITNANIKLLLNGTPVTTTVSLDSNSKKIVTITPTSPLTAGSQYVVKVFGAVSNINTIPMRSTQNAAEAAFTADFWVKNEIDTTAPSISAQLAENQPMPVNQGIIEFGSSEALNPTTITTQNITMKRGATAIAVGLAYDPGKNAIFVTPSSALLTNTAYTITFGTGIRDLTTENGGLGNALALAQNFTYTTSATSDNEGPNLRKAQCDDYVCTFFFEEAMNQDSPADSNYAGSAINPLNYTLTWGGANGTDNAVSLAGKAMMYDAHDNMYSVRVEGIGMNGAVGQKFRVTVLPVVEDISGNNNTLRELPVTYVGTVEDPQKTFGSFGGGGMFGPPMTGGGGGGGGVGGEFKPQGFGNFSPTQAATGQADYARPFNDTAGKDVDVFQVHFTPGIVLQSGDQVEVSFPGGTAVTNTVPDTLSPFYSDFNEGFRSGTITFDNTFGGDGITVDAATRTITAQLAVAGTPGANDPITIDLRGITNPNIAKGPDTGGYSVTINVKRAGQTIATKTPMPYYIHQGGSRSITVEVYVGSQNAPVDVGGDIYLFGGGPSGPMNQKATIANGRATIQYTSLVDGCYQVGSEPIVTLGGIDYYGQDFPEPICLPDTDDTPNTKTKNIVLTSAVGGNTFPLIVKFAGINSFQGRDIDIFAGGPGKFVKKTLSAVGVPAADGYTINLPQNGTWFIGVGPAMSKGTSVKHQDSLAGIPPPPVDLNLSGIGTDNAAITFGHLVPPGITLAGSTLTLNFNSADKPLYGRVTDGVNGLEGIDVFAHSKGFGMPVSTKTDTNGYFTMNVATEGPYEVGAFMQGLPPAFTSIDVRPDGVDADATPDVFFKGVQVADSANEVSNSQPLFQIKLKKGGYTISGKVLDSNNKAISHAPVFATTANGDNVGGGTSDDGSYVLFVDNGTWTVRSMLPPDKSDTCGSLSTVVTVSGESMANQNITPSTTTCYDLSGVVTVGGTALSYTGIGIEEWDAVNDRPAAMGISSPAGTDSNGRYTVSVPAGTYRVHTFHPDYGELSINVLNLNADKTDANITVAADNLSAITFAFTGGTSSMNAFLRVEEANPSQGTQPMRIPKQLKGLASNATLNVRNGTYNYFLDIFGVGNYTGQVTTGETATINLSTVSLRTISGMVFDANTNGLALSGVVVSARNATSGDIRTATTNGSGEYTLKLKDGTYTMSVSRAEYLPRQAAASLVVTGNVVNYDFGSANDTVGDQSGMQKTPYTISGTIYESDGVTAMTKGSAFASDANGLTVSTLLESNGAYSLPVQNGVWTVKAVGARHAKTEYATGAITVNGASQSAKNITLTADATRVSKTTSEAVPASTGGSVDDTENSGMKVTAGAGVWEGGSGNVTVSLEKTFTAQDSADFKPLCNTTFSISALGSDSAAIKTVNGNLDIQISYADMLACLPAGVTESNLKLVYYSPEADEYIPVEGGMTIDAANNNITGQSDHLTDFMIAYVPPTPVAPAPVNNNGGSGGAVVLMPTPTQSQTPAADSSNAKTPTTSSSTSGSLSWFEKLTNNETNVVAPAAKAAPVATQPLIVISRALTARSPKAEVLSLQQLLQLETGLNVVMTGKSDSQTKKAIEAFQDKYKIVKKGQAGFGVLGPKTLAKVNSLIKTRKPIALEKAPVVKSAPIKTPVKVIPKTTTKAPKKPVANKPIAKPVVGSK